MKEAGIPGKTKKFLQDRHRHQLGDPTVRIPLGVLLPSLAKEGFWALEPTNSHQRRETNPLKRT